MHEWTTGRSAPQTCHFCTEWVEQCVSALTLRRSRLSTRSCGGDWAVRAARVCTGFRGKEDTAIQHPCALLTRHVGNAPAFMMYRQARAGFSPTKNTRYHAGVPCHINAAPHCAVRGGVILRRRVMFCISSIALVVVALRVITRTRRTPFSGDFKRVLALRHSTFNHTLIRGQPSTSKTWVAIISAR